MAEQNATTEARGRSAGLSFGKLAPLILIAATALLVVGMGWHHALSLEALARRRAELDLLIDRHFAAALAGYVGLYVAAVALSVPGAVVLTIAGGILFGWFLGALAAALGATIGAIILFLVARGALSAYVARKLGPRLARLAEGFKADAFNYLLFLRLVPVFPFWLVNLAPALLGVSLRTFAAATAIGILPGAFAFAFVGAGLDSVIRAQEAAYQACLAAARPDCRLTFELQAAVTPQLLIALSALGLLALLPVLVRRWRTARATKSV
jgi:uncharacterized membrane protein YdjX (TVP38/TMEM64 family)